MAGAVTAPAVRYVPKVQFRAAAKHSKVRHATSGARDYQRREIVSAQATKA